jgi:serine/threonine protein kinase
VVDVSDLIELSQDALQILHEDNEFVLFRGSRKSDRSSLLVVAPASEHPAPATLSKLEHAYALRDALDPTWAAQPVALSNHEASLMLLLKDPGGEILEQSLGHPLELTEFLRIAIGLAVALGRMHARELIHKDIKPSNVLADFTTGEFWLLGFGIASRLPRERRNTPVYGARADRSNESLDRFS